jgi:biofilm PGA synthesis N-glycosyltransferase PgaC
MTLNSGLSYVLITPAHNEAKYIEKTIISTINQTVPPLIWMIVSDGSTDGTDEIISKYMPGHDFIRLVRLPVNRNRNFAAKVEAFNAGYKELESVRFDIIGNVDGDVSFGPDYFRYLLEQFSSDEKLGVAGTHYTEGDFHSFKDSFINVHHVNGQIQLFRKKCFEDIEGYKPNPGGGIDWVAVTTARMKGWKTYSFGDQTFEHLRTMGTAESSVLQSRYHYGRKDYFLGGHPLWELFRGGYQVFKKPYIIGGVCLLSGYFYSFFTRKKILIPKDLMAFHRKEQLLRLKGLIKSKFRLVHDK